MSSLGEDVDWEILRRLPVESLLRFKRVCKGWCSLISTPEFAKTHLVTAASPPRILLATDRPQSVSCGSPHDDDDDGGGGDHAGREGMALTQLRSPVEVPDGCRARIVGYCNGLVCVEYDYHRIVILWNPATGESRNIPNAGFLNNRGTICGLGYDPSTDDYKILRSCPVTDECGFTRGNAFDVFELKTGSWRRVHEKHDDLNHRPEVGRDSWEPEKIVSFCMSKEKFDDALLPLPEADEGTGFGVLGVVGACLLIFESMAEEYLFLEWMMSDYGVRTSSSWTKLCSVKSPESDINHLFQHEAIVLYQIREDSIQFDPRDMVIYDPEKCYDKVVREGG